MKTVLPFLPKPARSSRACLAGLWLLAYALVIAWANHLGRLLPRQALWHSGVHLELLATTTLGMAFEGLLVPIICMLYLASLPCFREMVMQAVREVDQVRMFGMLALCWGVVAAYDAWRFSRTFDVFLFGFLVVVLSGWLGGWRGGLCLGFLALLLSGIAVALLDAGGAPFLACLPGSGSSLAGCGFLVAFLFGNLKTAMILWVGLAAGWLAELLEGRRFQPAVMALSGAGLKLLAMLPVLLAVERPAEFSRFLLPETLAAALAMGLLGLVLRDIRTTESRRKAEQMELSLAQSELRVLRAQINPHFFFNALNTIRYFIRTKPETARALLLDLSELFQRALRAGDFVALRDELEYVRSYLALEQARLGERLRVDWSLPEDAWLEHPVPTLILQPLVENAVLHGISEKERGGTVAIAVQVLAGELKLVVEDDGPGFTPATLEAFCERDGANNCIGLRNVQARLEAYYGGERLVIQNRSGQGCRVEIRIPLQQSYPYLTEATHAHPDR
jgi:signal transduction histidine kinase